MKTHHITKINVIDVAIFIAIFEFFTLLLLPHINFGTIMTGLVDGFIGAVLAILLFNSLRFSVNFILDKKKKTLEKLDVFIPSLANGIFLAILFISQRFLSYRFIENMLLRNIVVGFVNTFIAIFFCIIIYNLIAKHTDLRLKTTINKKQVKIESIDLKTTPFFVAVFELFILPIMGIFFIIFENLPYALSSPLVGLFGGFIGCLIAAKVYNFLAKSFKGIGISIS